MNNQFPHPPRLKHLDVDRPARLAYDALWITSTVDYDKPVVAATGADMAIGAALLGELLASGHITIRPVHGREEHLVVPMANGPEPRESLGMGLIEQIRAEPAPLGVRIWLEYLAKTDVYTRVAEHMRTADLMDRVEVPQRRRWRRQTLTMYQPRERLAAGAALYRLRRWLEDPRRPISNADVFLLGLCGALGLDHVYHHRSDSARDQARERLQALPEPVRALLLHLADAIGSAGTARSL